MDHPDARGRHGFNCQVGMVDMEAGVTGRFKVVIILETGDVF